MKVFNVVSLVVIIALISISCGGGKSDGALLGNEVYLDEGLNVDSNSYLPLNPGIKTEFSDGPLFEGSSVSVDGLAIEVLEGGIIQITGRKTYASGYMDIVEKMEFEEKDNQIYLTGYDLTYTDSTGKTFANSRSYDPPVLLLQDKSNVTVGDVYSTFPMDVSYSGEAEEITVVYSGGAPQHLQISDLNDISAEVNIEDFGSVLLAGDEVDTYYVALEYELATFSFWYPLGGLQRGKFGLAKGIGIVNFAGRNAVSTNTIK